MNLFFKIKYCFRVYFFHRETLTSKSHPRNIWSATHRNGEDTGTNLIMAVKITYLK